uniref:Uncharacterized protein n=1 Tax=Oryzias sinensis TaxID=183150 RepID=A0A8C7ZID4_9TELE
MVSHEHGEVGEVAAGAGGVCTVGRTHYREYRFFKFQFKKFESITRRCLSVKTTGSVRNTRLDSLLIEAASTSELTAKRFLSWFDPSSSIFTVAFSVDRKSPRFLYRMKTTFTCPEKWTKNREIRGNSG